MLLLGLYVITLIIYVVISLLIGFVVNGSILPESEEEDEKEVHLDGSFLAFLIFLLLYIAGIISFAILPALGKGGFTGAIVSGLIFATVANVGSYAFNIKYIKFIGIKECLFFIAESIVTTIITVPISYYFAWLMLV